MSLNYATSRDVLTAWIRGLNEKNAEAVGALYAPEAILLPTFSNRTLRDGAGRRDYMLQLCARQGLKVDQHDSTLRVQELGGGLEVISGLYRFGYEIEGAPLTFEARFTFVVDLNRESPILHHHSSQIPRTLG